MIGISLAQPWAWSMTALPPPDRKTVENRRRPCPEKHIGSRIAIHASRTWAAAPLPNGQAPRDYIQRNVSEGVVVPGPDAIARGAIVALVTIDHQVTSAHALPEDQRRWFFGPWGYVFRDLELLASPVTCRGALGWWKVPPEVEAAVLSQLNPPT